MVHRAIPRLPGDQEDSDATMHRLSNPTIMMTNDTAMPVSREAVIQFAIAQQFSKHAGSDAAKQLKAKFPGLLLLCIAAIQNTVRRRGGNYLPTACEPFP